MVEGADLQLNGGRGRLATEWCKKGQTCIMEETDSQGRSWAVHGGRGGDGGSRSGGRDKFFSVNQSLVVLWGKPVVSVVCSTGESSEVYLLLSSLGSGW